MFVCLYVGQPSEKRGRCQLSANMSPNMETTPLTNATNAPSTDTATSLGMSSLHTYPYHPNRV